MNARPNISHRSILSACRGLMSTYFSATDSKTDYSRFGHRLCRSAPLPQTPVLPPAVHEGRSRTPRCLYGVIAVYVGYLDHDARCSMGNFSENRRVQEVISKSRNVTETIWAEDAGTRLNSISRRKSTQHFASFKSDSHIRWLELQTASFPCTVA